MSNVMIVAISGTRNGADWPKPGEPAPDDLSDQEVRDMLANGQISESTTLAGQRALAGNARYQEAVASNAARMAADTAAKAEESRRAAEDAETRAKEAQEAAERAKVEASEKATAVEAETSSPAGAEASKPAAASTRRGR